MHFGLRNPFDRAGSNLHVPGTVENMPPVIQALSERKNLKWMM